MNKNLLAKQEILPLEIGQFMLEVIYNAIACMNFRAQSIKSFLYKQMLFIFISPIFH